MALLARSSYELDAKTTNVHVVLCPSRAYSSHYLLPGWLSFESEGLTLSGILALTGNFPFLVLESTSRT